MHTSFAFRQQSIRFDESIRSLLQSKGNLVWSVSPDASVYRAIELMAEKHIGCLLVINRGRLLGIISERDYARKVILLGRNSMQTLVSEIMTKVVLTAHPEQSVDDALRLMTSRRVRHLPILEGDEVVGILSIGDLVNWILSSQEQTIQNLEGYIAGRYPG